MKLVLIVWLIGATLWAIMAVGDIITGEPWLLEALAALFYVAAGCCFYLSERPTA